MKKVRLILIERTRLASRIAAAEDFEALRLLEKFLAPKLELRCIQRVGMVSHNTEASLGEVAGT
jgi:hypothetical protein